MGMANFAIIAPTHWDPRKSGLQGFTFPTVLPDPSLFVGWLATNEYLTIECYLRRKVHPSIEAQKRNGVVPSPGLQNLAEKIGDDYANVPADSALVTGHDRSPPLRNGFLPLRGGH